MSATVVYSAAPTGKPKFRVLATATKGIYVVEQMRGLDGLGNEAWTACDHTIYASEIFTVFANQCAGVK